MPYDAVLPCAGDCGTTRPMSEKEAEIRKKIEYPINWWCDSCVEKFAKKLGLNWWGTK